MMNGIIENVNRWSNSAGLLFLCLLLATFLNEHINALRNIGLYSLAIMIVLYSATNKWELKSLDGYGVILILLTLVILQGVMRNEYGLAEGFDGFRKTYFKAYVLAIGVMLFVSNPRAISMAMWSLFIAAISILSNEVYRYISIEGNRFFYGGKGVHLSAHLIDFIDSVAVVHTKHNSIYVRYLAIALLAGFTILIIGTGTRGGWLAFVAGFIVAYFLVNYKSNMVRTVIKSTVRVAVVVFGIYLMAPDDSMVYAKFNKKLDTTYRVETIYPVYYESIVKGPLFGYGYTNNIEDRIPNIIEEDHDRFETALRFGPHNQFLLFGVHFGLLGVFIYIVMILWTLFRLMHRAIYSSDLGFRLLAAAGAGMLMAEYIVRSMTDPVFKHWIGVPIGIALIRLKDKES